MAAATTTFETFVSPEELMEIILAFEDYPDFLSEVTGVEVHARSETSADVTFSIDINFMGFKIASHYRLDYAISERGLEWKLKSSPDITVNQGSWRLEPTDDDETIAHYENEVATSLPIPPEIQSAFAAQELPRMMMKFRDRAEGL